jgi:hypothetical protein
VNNGKILDKEDAYNALLTSYLLNKVKRKKSSSTDESVEENYKQQQKLNQEDDRGRKMLKDEELYYDSDYVDTIPVEDYIIQQEVPAHLLDHEQLYGSQIRILGISDITPGTMFNVKGQEMDASALVDEYKQLHADNINASFDRLMEELGLNELETSNGHRILISEAPQQVKDRIYTKIATILQKELVSDGKYSVDLQKACRLVRNAVGVQGFAVPLMDPIQSRRIQELINSIIKKGINKQRITGGPVVQTTAYDSNLHIRFKHKNGGLLLTREEYEGWEPATHQTYEEYVKENQAGIAYFECYMPVPNAALERLMLKPDGSMMSYE